MDASWIHPADTANFASGFGQGAAIAQANASLAQQQQQIDQRQQLAMMQLEITKRNEERDFALKQQQMEISKAYHDAIVGVQKQKIADQKRMNDEKIRQFAAQSAAKMRMAQLAQQPGFDPFAAVFQNPDLPIKEYAPVLNAWDKRRATIPDGIGVQTYTTPEGDAFYYDRSGNPHPMPRRIDDEAKREAEYKKATDAAKIRTEGTIQANLYKDLAITSNEKKRKEIMAQIEESRKRIQDLGAERATIGGSGSAVMKYDPSVGAFFSADGKQVTKSAPHGLTIGGVSIGGNAPVSAQVPMASVPEAVAQQAPAPGTMRVGGLTIGKPASASPDTEVLSVKQRYASKGVFGRAMAIKDAAALRKEIEIGNRQLQNATRPMKAAINEEIAAKQKELAEIEDYLKGTTSYFE